MIVVLGRCPNGIKIFISCCTGSMKKFEDASGRREVLDVEKKKVQECIRRGRVIRQADNGITSGMKTNCFALDMQVGRGLIHHVREK